VQRKTTKLFQETSGSRRANSSSEKEKEIPRLQDELSAGRRELPWVKVEKKYVFDGPDGKMTLGDLFDGRSQLFVYHFMFGPDWEEGCPSCSIVADHFDGRVVASRTTRCKAAGRFTSAPAEDKGISEAHGLALQVGFIVRERL
jgi:predicted dithiol-disulfide oxidoreductase (DUF899 family)